MMFNNQASYSFTEFYEGIQDIKSHYDSNESLGRAVNFQKGHKGFKKITSVQTFNPSHGYKGSSVKKSSSSNEFEPNSYGRFVPNHMYNDDSTKESHSPFGSINSLSSVNSMPNSAQANAKAKQFNPNLNNVGKRKPPTEQDFKNKYKTEVCKYWAEHGYCEFGDSCAFAHGENEVRQKSFVASNYKTKKCAQYHEVGYCVYGIRCQFLHCYRKDCHFNPKLMYANYGEELENVDLWQTEDQDCLCLRRKSTLRLPVLKNAMMEKQEDLDDKMETFLMSMLKET